MSTSHLYSLRIEKRRERLEWLGDIVLEEIIVRLIARQALAALDWEEEEEERENTAEERAEREKAGSGHGGGAAAASAGPAERRETETETEGGFGVPKVFRPLSWRLDFATRLAVSNANLRAVYEDQLVGLMSLVGLEEDQFLLGLSGVGGDGAGGGGGGGSGKRKRCRSSSFSGSGVAAGLSPSAKKIKTGKDKQRLRCRSSSFGSAADATGASPAGASTKVNKRDKRMPDMVEAAIGEAFEASLGLDRGGRGGGGGGGGGGGSGAEALSEAGPQRFAGGHRAALVDRLLSTALNTEYFRSELQEPRASASGGGGGDGSTYGEELEGPYAYDDDFVSSSGFANSFGALDSSSSSDEDGGDGWEDDGRKRAKKAERVGQEKEETLVAQGVRAADGAADAGAVPDEVDRRGESIAAGRAGVLRLYGAVLLKFRTSVFLFCSAEAAEQGGGGGGGGENGTGDGDGDGGKGAESGKHGPFELTLRRQGVMSAENLEAVAEHLQSLQKDGADGGPGGRGGVGVAANTPAAAAAPAAAPPPAAGERARHRARDWMRVEVGRAALCGGGGGGGGSAGDADGLGVAFSTRVAALLLSRSGERGGPPKAEEGGGRGPGREERNGPVGVGAGARAAAMAVAEAQFGRDPWPEEDLPRASRQAARVFLPQGVVSRRGDGGATSGGTRPSRSPSPSPSSIPTADSVRDATAAAVAAGKKKKKHKREGGDGLFRVPPQYVGLLGQLPRDSRHLLARLGHQGYVKVLEDLLRGFLGVSSAAATTDAASAAAAAAAAEVVVPPAAADSASDAGVSGDKVDLAVSPDHTSGSSPRDDARDPGTPGSGDGPGQDHLQDPWRALKAGRPHPSLSGLVEPPELASAGAKRMVLPMPNPFYRRVLHALCRVHGLVSCGGETRRRAEAGGGKDGKRRAAADGHRTVEVTRGDGGGGGGWGSVKRPGDRRGGGAGDGKVLTLVPVEVLLAER